jgi:hypothetical protein
MIDKIVPVNSLFYMNTKLFTNCMEGVTQELFLKRPDINANNIAYIASHLLDARFFMGSLTGIQLVNPFKEVFDRIKGSDQTGEFPPVEEIISVWKEISLPIEYRLKEMTEDDLHKESPIQLPLTEKTVLGGLTFFIQHESFHIGQIAFLRKLLGLQAMRYI